MQNKKIVIAGGTGFIGQAIIEHFGNENQIIILSRCTQDANNSYGHKANFYTNPNVQLVCWNAKDDGEWMQEIDGADLVINLTGKSVNCRYTPKNKQAIFDSRTSATKAIGRAVAKATVPPKLWINAASATIYRHATDRPQDETTGEIENDFSVQVCKLWEQTFFEQRTPFTRKVALRMAITLGAGGVMVPYFNLIKLGLGGQQGDGKQMYSWVHVQDVCRMIDWAFTHTEIEGVYNCSSPNPVTNKVFMQTLRKVAGHLFGLPAFVWMLKIGAALIGTETELILKSRWVIPTKAIQAGFQFQYPNLKDTLAQIISVTPRKQYHLF